MTSTVTKTILALAAAGALALGACLVLTPDAAQPAPDAAWRPAEAALAPAAAAQPVALEADAASAAQAPTTTAAEDLNAFRRQLEQELASPAANEAELDAEQREAVLELLASMPTE